MMNTVPYVVTAEVGNPALPQRSPVYYTCSNRQEVEDLVTQIEDDGGIATIFEKAAPFSSSLPSHLTSRHA